jgi:hypothetical protein
MEFREIQHPTHFRVARVLEVTGTRNEKPESERPEICIDVASDNTPEADELATKNRNGNGPAVALEGRGEAHAPTQEIHRVQRSVEDVSLGAHGAACRAPYNGWTNVIARRRS